MGIAKTVINAFKMVENEEAIFLKKFPKLKKGYQIGIGASIAGYGLVSAVGSAKHASRYGEIEGGGLANTVNDTYSANLDTTIANAESNPDEFNNTVLKDNFSVKYANVSPEIVFALHNLRQGGGE
jgi:hypothetical protein